MLTRVILTLGSFLLIGGCSPYNERKLEGHVFAIPKLNDTSEETLFFLPPPDPRDGIGFILDPKVRLQDQIRVRVESKARICARAVGTGAQVNSTVCTSRPLPWRDVPLRKVKNGAFWSYNLPAPVDQKATVVLASCTEIGGGRLPGICNATLPFGDLVITIYCNDNQISGLEPLYDRAVADLHKWAR